MDLIDHLFKSEFKGWVWHYEKVQSVKYKIFRKRKVPNFFNLFRLRVSKHQTNILYIFIKDLMLW